MRRVADEPRVREIVGRPRLPRRRQLEPGGPRGGRRPRRNDVREHAGHQERGGVADGATTVAGIRPQQPAVGILHARDEMRRHGGALVGEHAVRRRQLHQREFAGAERERRDVRHRRRDPEALREVRRRADADLLQQLRRRAIARDLQRGPQRVLGLFVLAAGQPRAARRVDRRVEMPQDRRGRVPALERRGVNDRLERGSCLAVRLRRAIEAAPAEIASADERADYTVRGVNRDEAALQLTRGGTELDDLRDAARNRLLRRALHLRLVTRVDAKPAAQDLLAAEPRDQLAADRFLEIETARAGARRRRDVGHHAARVQRLVEGGSILGVGQPPRLAHQPQHQIAARERTPRRQRRRIRRRRSDDAGERGRFGGIEVGRGLREIAARRRLHAVIAVPVPQVG